MPKKFFRHKAPIVNHLHRTNFLPSIPNRPANGIFLFASGTLRWHSDRCLKTRTPTEINKNDVDRILDSVSDDRREKVSIRSEVNCGQNRTVDNIFENTSRTLREVSEPEQKRDDNGGHDPTG